MKIIYVAMFLFASCTPGQISIIEEAAEGELQIIEKVIEAESGIPRERPSVNVIRAHF